MNTVPVHVYDLAHEIMASATAISFLDDGERWYRLTGDEYTDLSAMAEMKFAISNCYAASCAVLGTINRDSLDLIRLTYDIAPTDAALAMRNHYAVVVDSRWVIDFTARQFSKTEQFPLVVSVDSWKSVIDGHVDRLFQQKPGTITTGTV